MKRRDVLKRAAALGVAGSFAGCVGQRDAPGGDGGDEASDGNEGTTTEAPASVASREVVSSNGTCGEENEASVAFEGETVRITGSIPASDPCHRAEMADSTFDADSGELGVTMDVVEDDSDVCQQCIARIEYEAVVEFTGGAPRRVTVDHLGASDGGTVTTADNPE